MTGRRTHRKELKRKSRSRHKPKHLAPGIHKVNVRGKVRTVRVNDNGFWTFLKNDHSGGKGKGKEEKIL